LACEPWNTSVSIRGRCRPTDKLSVLSEPCHARRICSYYLDAETSSISSVFVARGYLRAVVPNRGGISPQGGISWVQGRIFHFIVNYSLQVLYVIFKLTLALSISYITIFARYSVSYHTFLLTNFSAIIWQQIDFVPLLLIKFLSSIKTVVPIVVNTSVRTRTREERAVHRGGMQSPKMSKGRNASKKVGNHCLRANAQNRHPFYHLPRNAAEPWKRRTQSALNTSSTGSSSCSRSDRLSKHWETPRDDTCHPPRMTPRPPRKHYLGLDDTHFRCSTSYACDQRPGLLENFGGTKFVWYLARHTIRRFCPGVPVSQPKTPG